MHVWTLLGRVWGRLCPRCKGRYEGKCCPTCGHPGPIPNPIPGPEDDEE